MASYRPQPGKIVCVGLNYRDHVAEGGRGLPVRPLLVFRDPPVFLEPGDRARCEIERIGAVENPVIDWSDLTSSGVHAHH